MYIPKFLKCFNDCWIYISELNKTNLLCNYEWPTATYNSTWILLSLTWELMHFPLLQSRARQNASTPIHPSRTNDSSHKSRSWWNASVGLFGVAGHMLCLTKVTASGSHEQNATHTLCWNPVCIEYILHALCWWKIFLTSLINTYNFFVVNSWWQACAICQKWKRAGLLKSIWMKVSIL